MALFDPVRYFLNTAAAKPVVAGGYTFEFELVGLRGGSWLGILAVDEPAASVLAAAHPSNTDEISLEIYNLQKKKSSATLPPSPRLPRPMVPEPALAVAEPAANPMSRAASKPADSTVPLTPVTLLATFNAPPAEPLLAQPNIKRRSFST